MGSLPDDDDKTDIDLSDNDTLSFDSQFPPDLFSGGEFKDEDIYNLQSLHGTVPFDDTLSLEDDFETQLVNLGGETQLMNLGGETQVVNEETQVVNDEIQVVNDEIQVVNDETQVVNDETQVVNDETQVVNDETQVVHDETQVVNDETQVVNFGGDTQVSDYLDFAENKGIQLSNDCDTEFVDTDDESSVRTEILCDTEEVSDDSSLKNVGEKVELETKVLTDEGCNSGSAPRGFTSLRVASVRAAGLAARASANSRSCSTTSMSQSLKQQSANEEVDQGNTTGDFVEQMKGISNKNKCRPSRSAVRKLFIEDDDKLDKTKGLVEEAESRVAGLSYVDSQEPGEASQAHALDVVDRFLKVSVEEFDRDVNFGMSVRARKSKEVSSAKGIQILAKSVNLLSSGGKTCTFDFDDNHEDEGGGDFFRKKKEVLLGNQWGRSSKLNKKGGAKSKKSMEAKLAKNLVKEFDEENDAAHDHGPAETIPNTDMVDMMNVGLDTQMAAEAMEALCCGGPKFADDDANQGLKGLQNGPHKKETKKLVSLSTGVVTRQSKQRKRNATNLCKQTSKLSPKSSTKVHSKLIKGDSTKGIGIMSKGSSMTTKKGKGGESEIVKIHDIDKNITCQVAKSAPIKNQCIQGQYGSFTTVAQSTRQRIKASLAKSCGAALSDATEVTNMTGSGDSKDKRKRKRDINILGKEGCSDVDILKHEESYTKLYGTTTAVEFYLGEYPRRKRTTRKRELGASGRSTPSSKTDIVSASVDVVVRRSTRSSVNLKSSNITGCTIAKDVEASPCKPYDSTCTTPVSCLTPINTVSPICMGDEYFKLTHRKTKLALVKELHSLISSGKESISPNKDSRQRREMASVKVLFSRHLDGEIIKHQKKILTRLGASVVSSLSEATHFIADEFVRTRNMLEAIAFGKPVVTHLWLESCGQAKCLIDERNYILRDAKKEKEFCFSLPVSLARASKQPLLQGRRVFITPNTKPSREIVASLVKAVHGLALERMGRSVLKDNQIPDDLLVLSCEEDYEVCVPYLEKGVEVFSSELLLDGIVTQKLEYHKYQLFLDHVKKTRSTIWLRKKTNQFQPVARCK